MLRAMGDEERDSDRRRAMRVPVRGMAVFYGETGAVHGRIENLSETGALVSMTTAPWLTKSFELELKLGEDTGWVSARAVRVEHQARRLKVAVQFDRLDEPVRAAIESAISAAVHAAVRRPVIVIDDHRDRRDRLAHKLSAAGMLPLLPSTPLEAIDLLARAQLHADVCLLAPSFGQTRHELAALVTDSFPWVTLADIEEDLDATVARASEAWSSTDVARLFAAIA